MRRTGQGAAEVAVWVRMRPPTASAPFSISRSVAASQVEATSVSASVLSSTPVGPQGAFEALGGLVQQQAAGPAHVGVGGRQVHLSHVYRQAGVAAGGLAHGGGRAVEGSCWPTR